MKEYAVVVITAKNAHLSVFVLVQLDMRPERVGATLFDVPNFDWPTFVEGQLKGVGSSFYGCHGCCC